MANGNSRSRRLNLPTAITIWALIVAGTAFAGAWFGFGGRAFAVALGVAALLFAFEFWLAAPNVLDHARTWLGGHGRFLAPIVPLFAVIIYSFGVTQGLKWMLVGAAYAVIPSLLLASSSGKAPGAWEDYVAAIFIWLGVWPTPPYRLLYHIFPSPPPLTHTLSILMALSTAVAAYVLLRRLDGIGYAIEWGRGFSWNFGFHFVVLAAILIPLGLKIGFLRFAPSLGRPSSLLVAAIGIPLFTAWPEEFLFRGVLQNCLTRTLKSERWGLLVASVVFGFSHILHAPAPNWKYVLMATIAGIFYGRAWMKTGSLLPGTLVHALIDFSWHILFK